MQPRRFNLNTESRSFETGNPLFFQEDVESVELYFVRPNLTGESTYIFEDYSANTIKLAIGVTTPAVLQASWTAISTAITASITTLTNGGSGANEVQLLTFSGNTPSEGGFSLTMPARAVTVSSVSAGLFTSVNHGLLDGQSVTLSAFTISGSSFENSTYLVRDRTKDTFRITEAVGYPGINAQVTSGGGTASLPAITTGQIARNAGAIQVQQAFIDAGIEFNGFPQVLVSGSYAQGYTFTFIKSQANINFDPMTVSSTLASAKGLQANVSFNTSEVAALIAAGTTSGLKFEVEVTDGARRQTYQTTCSLSDDIISSTSPTPTPSGSLGFSMLSPDNSQWTITVDNNGIVTATKA